MEIYELKGEDFKTIMTSDSWTIAMMRYSDRLSDFDITKFHRHNKTDEAFILLEGSAQLYEYDVPHKLEKFKVYCVKRGTWHQMVLSRDATVLVVENSDTTSENTDKNPLKFGYKH